MPSDSDYSDRTIRSKGSSTDSSGGRGDPSGDGADEFGDEPDSGAAVRAEQTLSEVESKERSAEEGRQQAGNSDQTASGDSPQSVLNTSDGFGSGETSSSSGDRGPSPGNVAEFAHSTLSQGAIDPKHRDGPGEITAFPPSEPSHSDRIGGWDEFANDPAVVEQKEPVGDGGFTQDCMTVATLSDEVDADRAFVTDSTASDPFMDDPSRGTFGVVTEEQQASQICLYAFCESMGIDGPDVTYHQDREFVAVKEADFEGDAKNVDDMSVWSTASGPDQERAANVDLNELKDMLAAHALAGNWDLSPDNVVLDEEGNVHIFDYDRMSQEWSDTASVEAKMKKYGEKTMDWINDLREQHPDADKWAGDEISAEALTDRAVEIATALKDSGHDKVVVDAVSQYADQFPDHIKHGEIVRSNIDTLSQ